ncbi:MAG: hypothetical protein AAB542_01630 [Patescibacteria group bacterium]
MNLLADVSLGQIGGSGLGPFGESAGDGITGITKIVSSIIGIMTVAAGIWFLFQFIIGGFNWINSGGDKAKLQTSRDRLTNALIGLIVVVAGWAILALAGTFFGFDFTLSNPGSLLEQLNPNQ